MKRSPTRHLTRRSLQPRVKLIRWHGRMVPFRGSPAMFRAESWRVEEETRALREILEAMTSGIELVSQFSAHLPSLMTGQMWGYRVSEAGDPEWLNRSEVEENAH